MFQEEKQKLQYDKKYTNRVMLILAFLVMTVMYVEGMLTPSLPSIAHDFNISISQVSLVLSVYLVSGVALSPIVGKLGDIYGKKKVMLTVLAIYAGAVLSTGFSPDFTYMLISRGIQGIGLTVMPLGMSLVREEFPRDLVPKAQALLSALFGAGFAVSLPLGSLVSNDLGWRYTYHTAVPVVFTLVIISAYWIKESEYRRPGTRIDYFGATIFAIALALEVVGLSEGPVLGWTSHVVIFMFIAGSILFIPTLIYERSFSRKTGEAIINYRLLSKRNVWIPNLVISVSGLAMFLSMQALVYRFETPSPYGFGISILSTGLSLIPLAGGMIVFGPISGSLITKYGVKKLAVIGPIITSIGFLLEATNPSYALTLAYAFIVGSGLSVMNASVINILVLSVDPRDMGLATSMNGTFRSFGSSIGAPLAGAILSTFSVAGASVAGYSLSIPSNYAFDVSFIIAVILNIVSAIIVIFSREVINVKGRISSDQSKVQNDVEFQATTRAP